MLQMQRLHLLKLCNHYAQTREKQNSTKHVDDLMSAIVVVELLTPAIHDM